MWHKHLPRDKHLPMNRYRVFEIRHFWMISFAIDTFPMEISPTKFPQRMHFCLNIFGEDIISAHGDGIFFPRKSFYEKFTHYRDTFEKTKPSQTITINNYNLNQLDNFEDNSGKFHIFHLHLNYYGPKNIERTCKEPKWPRFILVAF